MSAPTFTPDPAVERAVQLFARLVKLAAANPESVLSIETSIGAAEFDAAPSAAPVIQALDDVTAEQLDQLRLACKTRRLNDLLTEVGGSVDYMLGIWKGDSKFRDEDLSQLDDLNQMLREAWEAIPEALREVQRIERDLYDLSRRLAALPPTLPPWGRS